MSTRSRKTLMVAARLLIVAACLVLLWKSRGASWSGILPWAGGLAVIWAALTSVPPVPEALSSRKSRSPG
jgi:hypothetical protein